jgi:L-2,4-diaminobutyric acid acetyltransferase
MTKQPAEIVFRQPTIEDGSQMWQLIHDCGSLDVNSTYAYLLLCKHFAETCAVAELKGEVVGVLTGYYPPKKTNTLFFWQIGVADSMRRTGIAKRLLVEVLQRNHDRKVSFLELTIGSSNTASRSLFKSLAQELNAEVTEEMCFDESLFPQGNHEAEYLLRIGPVTVNEW